MTDDRERLRDRRPAGESVDPSWTARPPARIVHDGRYARLEPLDASTHTAELYAASHGDDARHRIWDYLAYGPFATADEFRAHLRSQADSTDPLFFAIRDTRTGLASGVASYLNVVPAHGTIEIGHIWLGPTLQNTAAATEALYLLIRHALDDLGYRRMEWKCNALNEPSRNAARRLGFTFEGIFYNHFVSKGCNRDTAWYSILDDEWPPLRANFETWLAPDNFDEAGRQRASLGDLNRTAR